MWTEPKTDWQPGDGIRASDFNRVERNTVALVRGCYEIGGSQLVSIFRATSPIPFTPQRIVRVPAECKLILIHAAQANVNSMTVSCRIGNSVIGTWPINGNIYDEDVELYYNTENSTQNINIRIESTLNYPAPDNPTDSEYYYSFTGMITSIARVLVVNA